MRPASVSPFILSPVAHAVSWLVLGAMWCAPQQAHAQTAAPQAQQAASAAPAGEALPGEGLKLKSTPMLSGEVSNRPEDKGPTFVFGDRVSGRPDLDTTIDGNAELRRGATS